MAINNLFYQYYDTLFKHKGYRKETEMVFSLCEKFGIKNPKKILEIGCGSGNHTVLLSKKVEQIVAIDIDQNMINLVSKKIKKLGIKNITLEKTDIEKLKEQNFDLIIALFNVVTYLPNFEVLENFMKAAADRLKPKGLLIFDLWNGIAAILDPPKTKIIKLDLNGKKIKSKLTPKTDFFKQLVQLNYQLTIYQDSNVERQDSFSINQTLWTPMQIQNALDKAGFETLFCSPLLKPNSKAKARDWKIMFCAKKLN